MFAQRRNRSSPHPLLSWLYHSNGCPHLEHPTTGAFLGYFIHMLCIADSKGSSANVHEGGAIQNML